MKVANVKSVKKSLPGGGSQGPTRTPCVYRLTVPIRGRLKSSLEPLVLRPDGAIKRSLIKLGGMIMRKKKKNQERTESPREIIKHPCIDLDLIRKPNHEQE